MTYRKLGAEEIVTIGDYVTIDGNEASGFRKYNGRVGIEAGPFCYPIYRLESIYIQIRDCDDGAVLTVDVRESKRIIDSMVENEADGNTQEYTFSTVTMTEQEFKALPEFLGF